MKEWPPFYDFKAVTLFALQEATTFTVQSTKGETMGHRVLTFLVLLAAIVLVMGTLPVSAALTVQKTVDFNGDGVFTDSETNLIGQPVNWKVTVTNAGASAVNEVVVTDTLTGTLGTVSLAAGESTTFDYAQTTDTAGTFVNTAAAQGVDEAGVVVGPVSDSAEITVIDRLSESAWAAEANPGETRFVPAPGDWATYVKYTIGAGTVDAPKAYPLFAGQTNLAGSLLVYDDGAGTAYVKYAASGLDSDPPFVEGYTGAWSGLTEYHLQAAGVFDQFNTVRTYNKKAKTYGGPIPGHFQYSAEYEEIAAETDWIAVDITGFSSDVFLAAHAVMWWVVAPAAE